MSTSFRFFQLQLFTNPSGMFLSIPWPRLPPIQTMAFVCADARCCHNSWFSSWIGTLTTSASCGICYCSSTLTYLAFRRRRWTAFRDVACISSAYTPRTLSNKASSALTMAATWRNLSFEAQSWCETICSIERRFFLVLLGELSSWREHTRNRSTELLLILMAYCEEVMMEDFHCTVALVAKAIGVEMLSQSKNDPRSKLGLILLVLSLMGKYTDPAA
jgi:hypothetical protein